MKTQIVARVKINFDDPRKTDVVIKKVVKDDEDRLVGIYGLSTNGEWLQKVEGQAYPPECHLPIMIYDNFSSSGLLDAAMSEEQQ